MVNIFQIITKNGLENYLLNIKYVFSYKILRTFINYC